MMRNDWFIINEVKIDKRAVMYFFFDSLLFLYLVSRRPNKVYKPDVLVFNLFI